MKVLAISGFKRSGKDMTAEYLSDKYGTLRVSFAGPLKDSVSEEYGIPREWSDDPKKKEAPLLNLPVNPQDGFSQMLSDFMRLEFRDKDGNQYKKDGPEKQLYWTPRALCILKGSVNRTVDSSFWVKQACNKIKKMADVGFDDLFIITDLRYRSEMRQLKDNFGEDVVFIRINRFSSCNSKDPSENDLNNEIFDFYIENTGTKEQAFERADEIMNRIGIKKL